MTSTDANATANRPPTIGTINCHNNLLGRRQHLHPPLSPSLPPPSLLLPPSFSTIFPFLPSLLSPPTIDRSQMKQQDVWDHMHEEPDFDYQDYIDDRVDTIDDIIDDVFEPDFDYQDYVEDRLDSPDCIEDRDSRGSYDVDEPILCEIMKAKAMRDEYGADYFQSKGDVKCCDARADADPYIARLWKYELGDAKEHQSNLLKYEPTLKSSKEEWVAVKPPALESRVQQLEAVVKELQDGMAQLQKQNERVMRQQIHTITGEVYRRTQRLIHNVYTTRKRKLDEVLRLTLNKCYEIIEVAKNLVIRVSALNSERGGGNGDGGEDVVVIV